MEHPSIADETLREKIKEIEQTLALYKEGKTIIGIAGSLDFAQSYVQDVLLCTCRLRLRKTRQRSQCCWRGRRFSMSILNVEHLTHGFGDRAIFS